MPGVQVIKNVVIVAIDGDGSISVIGPFLSPQAANQYITRHLQGVDTLVTRMVSP